MIMKLCNRCHKPVAVGTTCPCIEKMRKAYRDNAGITAFYSSDDWKKVRSRAIANQFGLDVFELMTSGKILYGRTLHHITPFEDDYSKRFDINNLIFVTEKNHRAIHSAMKQDYSGTIQEVSQKLADFYRIYQKNFDRGY